MTKLQRRDRFHEVALLVFAAGIGLGEGVALLGLGLSLIGCIWRRDTIDWQALRAGPMGIWLAGWCAWFIIGVTVTVIGSEGVLRPSEISRHVSILAAPAVFLSIRSLPLPIAKQMAKTLLFVILVSSAFGLYQWLSDSHPFTYFVRADSAIATQAVVPGTGGSLAATGFFFHRLKMAHVLTLAVGLTIGLLFAVRQFRKPAFFALLVFFGCLMGTYAKAAIVATLASAALMVFMLSGPSQRRVLSGLTAIGLVAIWLREPSLSGRLADSLAVREMIWAEASKIITDYPGGVGLGNYSTVVGRYYDLINPAFHVRTYPHQMVLAWWAEAGIAGMVAVVFGWLSTMVHAFKAATESSRSAQQRSLHASLFFSLLAFWIIGLTHDVLYHPSVALMFFGVVGWIMSQCENSEEREII